jgi:hypothetical protein
MVSVVRDKAKKLECLIACILELVHVIGLDQDHVTSSDRMSHVAFIDFTFSLDYVHLMFVGVMMPRCVTAGLDFELPHGEIGGSIVAAKQPADPTTAGTFHIHDLQIDLFRGLYLHRISPQR